MKKIEINTFFDGAKTICVGLDGVIKDEAGKVLTPTLCDIETLAPADKIIEKLKKRYPNFEGEYPSTICYVKKYPIPQHLTPHILAVKELCNAGISIELAAHSIAKIYDLSNAERAGLCLSFYYEQRYAINHLIAEYENDLVQGGDV